MTLSSDLKKYLISQGATEVGFANLKNIENVPEEMPNGISIIVTLSKKGVRAINTNDKKAYFNTYNETNEKLDDLALKGEKFLKSKGFKAYGLSRDRVKVDEKDKLTSIPHKTVATSAGLGWIGKCALLVTNDYGSAIRLTTILTNAPLDFGKPMTSSLCGMCLKCKDSCPANAVSGMLWRKGLNRNDFFDYKACAKTVVNMSKYNFDSSEIKICGKCIYVCPHTQRFLNE
ncbi:MAG: 4Fe-4S dicluster domain-containing protein [Methanobacteriaceae archaeon]|jgi:epoxyqueuosine reductase QueG|nr:4Fe-4S dicluster domain-containing protein [Methanobacteriaceae archaeon]